jgi:hypothetical protein
MDQLVVPCRNRAVYLFSFFVGGLVSCFHSFLSHLGRFILYLSEEMTQTGVFAFGVANQVNAKLTTSNNFSFLYI